MNDLLVHKDGTCTYTSNIGMENLGRLSWTFWCDTACVSWYTVVNDNIRCSSLLYTI